MPSLTISVTDAQAARIDPALRARYTSTDLASATLAVMARDFIFAQLNTLVQEYEMRQARAQAEAQVREL